MQIVKFVAGSRQKLFKKGVIFYVLQTPPTAEEIGHCAAVRQDEIGDKNVVIFEHAPEGGNSKICTLALRAATENIMDDLERAVDDGVNNFKVLTRVSFTDTCVKSAIIDKYLSCFGQ